MNKIALILSLANSLIFQVKIYNNSNSSQYLKNALKYKRKSRELKDQIKVEVFEKETIQIL